MAKLVVQTDAGEFVADFELFTDYMGWSAELDEVIALAFDQEAKPRPAWLQSRDERSCEECGADLGNDPHAEGCSLDVVECGRCGERHAPGDCAPTVD